MKKKSVAPQDLKYLKSCRLEAGECLGESQRIVLNKILGIAWLRKNWSRFSWSSYEIIAAPQAEKFERVILEEFVQIGWLNKTEEQGEVYYQVTDECIGIFEKKDRA